MWRAFMSLFKGKKTKNTGLAVAAVAAVSGGFVFGERSKANLDTICPAPKQLAYCAITKTEVDFMVIEGFRPQERQNKLFAQGRTEPGRKVTWTLNSKHTTGQVIDIAALIDGRITWEPEYYFKINDAFEECSEELNIDYTWGGTFKGRDYVHFETKVCFVQDTEADI
jgi:peptidoglycan LD-endopeptidase CwlK